MNVLFVYSLAEVVSFEKPLAAQDQMQFGVAYISAFLKAAGHKTRLVVLSREFRARNAARLTRAVEEFGPAVICFSAVATEFDFIVEMSAFVKERWPSVQQLVGGAHVTLNPEAAVGHPFDAICVGEGEEPVREYLDALSAGKTPAGIPNLWIRTPGGMERNLPRPFLQDLDALPWPDREIWQEWVTDTRQERFPVLLGRGCPFLCAYCSNHALRKVAPGQYVRMRSPANVMKEIEDLAARHPALQEIYFEVETIAPNQTWAGELCEKLASFNAARQTPLSFGVNLRVTPNQKLEGLFAAFRRANFRFVNIGVESGSERVRREILKRQYSNQDIISAVEMARKNGLQVCFFNLMGIPGETEDDFRETIEINRICQPDWYFLSIFYPYPGTELYDRCRAMNVLPESLASRSERRCAVLDLPTFPRRRVMHQYLWFDYHVRKGHRKLHKIYMTVLATWLLSHRWTAALFMTVQTSRLTRPVIRLLKGE